MISRSHEAERWRSGAATLCIAMIVVTVSGAGVSCGSPQMEPQWGISPTGERYAPLSKGSKVKIYRRGKEPEVSYRLIGKITSTCPLKHWVRGQHKKGRPICVSGLRQGARKLGAQAVVEVKTKRYRPEWEPENPWLIMRAHAVRLSP